MAVIVLAHQTHTSSYLGLTELRRGRCTDLFDSLLAPSPHFCTLGVITQYFCFSQPLIGNRSVTSSLVSPSSEILIHSLVFMDVLLCAEHLILCSSIPAVTQTDGYSCLRALAFWVDKEEKQVTKNLENDRLNVGTCEAPRR